MLQGSLDNFALDEVLGLLATTSKTGKLHIRGDRGSGELTLHRGKLVDAVASNAGRGAEPEEVLFELLRFRDGRFDFNATDPVAIGSEPANGAEGLSDMSEVLAVAEERLADWRSIESVVPSLKHVVTPVGDPPADEITLNRQEWAALMVIAGGCPVSKVCDALDLGEVEGSRQIKALAERDLVTVGAPRPGPPPPVRPPAGSSYRTNDPFARRAAQSAVQHASPSAPPPVPRPPPQPARTPILEDPERVPAAPPPPPPPTGAVGGPGGVERRVQGPPSLAPPHPDDVRAGAGPGDGGDGGWSPGAATGGAPAATTVVDPGHDDPDFDDPGFDDPGFDDHNGDDPDEAPKSGGLLMRYLKSDG